jgi:hypothetical protein
MPALNFPTMSNSASKQLETYPSLVRITEKQACTAALVFMLFTWLLFSATAAILFLALLLPGHFGLSDLLRALGDLLPVDPVIYAT